ncbi:hypothetical protein C7377_1516 [Balneicella halophila]|uniref:Secreted protein n=1 Tax=Balneicella halophila TaxID=1537566 RepID=A0A7L4UNG6_BALHA|nr:SIMPL domain-containing protein [Balneicella halophila]PVX49878.1 hypothetical protein C7377_1516 [Balneicella halophila]
MRKIILLLIAFVTAVASVFAQEETPNIQVLGTSSVKTSPENVIINIPVSVKHVSYEECYSLLVDKLSRLQEAFKAIGVDNKQLKISGFSISENYRYIEEKEENKLIGYSGEAFFNIEDTYEKQLLQQIIEIISENETSYNVKFKLSEEQKEKLRKEAIENAVKDAKNKAVVLAKSSGIVLGDIIKIKYGVVKSASYFGDMLDEVVVTGYSNHRRRLNSLDLSPQEITISKEVVVVWAIDM